MFGTGADPKMTMVKYLFLLIVSSFSLFKYKLSKKQINVIAVIALLILASAFLSFSFLSGGLLILLLTIILAITTTNKYTLSDFCKLFVDLILALNIYSTIIWILVSLHIIEPSVVENVIGVELLSSHFCQFFSGSIPGFFRASSIFREPGMYMIFISMSYAFEVFILRRTIGWFKLIVYLISILSTFSTAGFIIFGILYIVSIMSSKRKNHLRSKVIPICAMLAIVVFIKNNDIAQFVFGKFSSGENSASYLGRVSSIMIPLTMIFHSPIWGCGITNFKILYIQTGSIIYHTTINPDSLATNTILNLAAIFGLPFCMVIMYGIYKFSMRPLIPRSQKLILLLCILLMFSNESAPYSIPFYWLAFYGFFPSNKSTYFSTKL